MTMCDGREVVWRVLKASRLHAETLRGIVLRFRDHITCSPVISHCSLLALVLTSTVWSWNVEAFEWDPVAMELHWPCGAADCTSVTRRTCSLWSCTACFDSCRITYGTGNMRMIDLSTESFLMILLKRQVDFDPVDATDDELWGLSFCLELYRVSDNLTLRILSIRLKTWRLPPAHFSSGFPFGLVPGVRLHSYGGPLYLYWPLYGLILTVSLSELFLLAPVFFIAQDRSYQGWYIHTAERIQFVMSQKYSKRGMGRIHT